MFVIYPLSAGPATEIGHRLHWPYSYEVAYNAIYAPLLWLCRVCPPVNGFYAWYLRAIGVY